MAAEHQLQRLDQVLQQVEVVCDLYGSRRALAHPLGKGARHSRKRFAFRRGRARLRRRRAARAAKQPACPPRGRAAVPPGGAVRGLPARCRMVSCLRKAQSSTPSTDGLTTAGMGAGRTAFSSVLRQAVRPNLRPRRTPAEPPSARPTAVSRPARRVVLRTQGAPTSGRRPAKTRRSHETLSQNMRRTSKPKSSPC